MEDFVSVLQTSVPPWFYPYHTTAPSPGQDGTWEPKSGQHRAQNTPGHPLYNLRRAFTSCGVGPGGKKCSSRPWRWQRSGTEAVRGKVHLAQALLPHSFMLQLSHS